MSARSLLRDDDLSPDEQADVLALAVAMKADRFATRPLAGPRTVAVLFDKPSLRTRVSFAAGVSELGGYPLIVNDTAAQFGRGEPIADIARVLGRQCAAIVWRTYAQSGLEELAAHAGVPVVNALSDFAHPCQLLADLLTIRERLGATAGVRLSYLGDGSNNMATSYLLAGATAGMHVRIVAPESAAPEDGVLQDAARIAAGTGGSVAWVADPGDGVAGADVVATDTWVSMGGCDSDGSAAAAFAPYAVTRGLLAGAPGAIVLHCLPAYRGREIEAAVIDDPETAIWDQAENRLHAQKALLTFLLERSR